MRHHWDGGMKWLDIGDLDIIFKVTLAPWNSNFDRKSLCAHYLLNQWLEFYQTSTNTSLGHRKEVIRFWWPWPHFQGHYIIKTKNEPCVHSLSRINRWNLTKLAQLHHWDGGMKWLDFGDLDLIFKVTLALWNSNVDRKKPVCTLSLEPMAGILLAQIHH